MENPKEEPKQICDNCKIEISKYGCGCGKQEEPKPVWKQIIETCGGEEEFMKATGLLPKQETLEEIKPPIGKFIIENAIATQESDGAYYHYSEVCKLLKLQAERMNSEADKIIKFLDTEVELKLSDVKTIERIKWYFETHFEQFKKKQP